MDSVGTETGNTPLKKFRGVAAPTTEELVAKTKLSKLYSSGRDITEEENWKIMRVGVIPYTVVPEPDGMRRHLAFAVALDATYGEITDCGGMRNNCEPIEATAARELYEESACVFDFRWNLQEIINSPAIVNSEICVFFLRVPASSDYGFFTTLPRIFSDNLMSIVRYGHAKRSVFMENSTMFWIPECDISRLVVKHTRKVIPRRYHESQIEPTPYIGIDTAAMLRVTMARLGIETRASAKGNIRYPHMYEKIRLALMKPWADLVALL